jgi:hypothetical protein
MTAFVGEQNCEMLCNASWIAPVAAPTRRRFATALSPASAGEGEESYTDAVVTPPSTTMVWPVMKLAASEPR